MTKNILSRRFSPFIIIIFYYRSLFRRPSAAIVLPKETYRQPLFQKNKKLLPLKTQGQEPVISCDTTLIHPFRDALCDVPLYVCRCYGRLPSPLNESFLPGSVHPHESIHQNVYLRNHTICGSLFTTFFGYYSQSSVSFILFLQYTRFSSSCQGLPPSFNNFFTKPEARKPCINFPGQA